MQILPLSFKENYFVIFQFSHTPPLIGLGDRIGIFLIFCFFPQTIKYASLGENKRKNIPHLTDIYLFSQLLLPFQHLIRL